MVLTHKYDFLLLCIFVEKRPDIMSILSLSLKWSRVSREEITMSTTAEDVLEEPVHQVAM